MVHCNTSNIYFKCYLAVCDFGLQPLLVQILKKTTANFKYNCKEISIKLTGQIIFLLGRGNTIHAKVKD